MLKNHEKDLKFDVPISHMLKSPEKVTLSTVFAVAWCLSVCMSVMFVYCIQMAEDIVKLLARPGSPVINF